MLNYASLHAFISRRLYLLPAALAINLITVAVAAVLPIASITVTKTAALLVDVNSNGKVDPGDTLRYTVVIRNSGIVSATNIVVSDTLDANTILVPNSIKVFPVAASDDYTAIGNVGITVPAVSGLLANDFGLPAPAVIATSGASTQGGQFSVNADGSFTYDPPVGFRGTDAFNYTITNTAGSDSATVTVVVSGMVWFINNNAGACSSVCDGRLSHPFASVGAFTAVNDGTGTHPAANDAIFAYESATPYGSAFSLLNGQRLIGQDATISVATLTGLTLPAYSSFPAMNSGNATLVTLSSGIILAQNDRLYGFTAGNASGNTISGTNFGTLTVRDVSINTTNRALSLNNGTADAIFAAVTSSGGTNNVSLTSLGGSLNLGGGAMSGASGDAYLVNGGAASISYNGSISNTTARPVSVTNKTGGAVSFGGAVSGSSSGVNLSSNTGATINFTGGGMSLSTGANIAFNATGGGVVNVTGANNTLATSGGTALLVQNTTIGASGLMFRSIASTGGSSRGIVLDNTGASGGLTVTGNGAPGTGGTIANKTGGDGDTANGIGIYLNNTSNVSLAYMQLNDFQNFAIRGFSVVNFILDNTVINGVNGTNDAINEDSVAFDGLTGAVTISNDNISGGYEDNFRVRNSSGTLNRITFSNTTIGANGATFGDDGVYLEASNAGTQVDVTVQNSFFTSARGDLIQLNMLSGSTMDLVFTGNTLSNNHPNIVSGGGGATLSGNGAFTYNISNNTFRDASGSALNIASMGSAAVFSGRVEGNTIGVSGVAGSGSAQSNGIWIQSQGGGDHTVLVDNNIVQQYNGAGIMIQSGDMQGNAVVFNATATNNTVRQPAGFATNGIHLNNGTVSSDNFAACVDIRSNTLAGSGANGGTDFRLRQRQATTVRLPGYAGANNDNAAAVSFIQSGNPGSPTGSAINSAPAGGGFVGAATCAQPALLTALQSTNTALAATRYPMDSVALQNTGESLALFTAYAPAPVVSDQATGAPSPHQSASVAAGGETINLGPFTLPVGKAITITFDATITDPIPAGITQVSNQAHVSGGNFGSVDSDDPNTPAPNDPTVTALDVYSLTVGIAGNGAGIVTSAPAGIACGAGTITCTADYLGGTVVTLTATPGITSSFQGWAGACANGAGVCVVTMTQTQSVTATFVITTLADLSISENGVTRGNAITFTAVISNNGPADASGAIVSGSQSSNGLALTWSCIGANGATCSQAGPGIGNVISDTLPSFPAGGVVTFTITTTLAPPINRVFSSMEVIPPAGITDPNLANNHAASASDFRVLLILVLRDS